MRRRVVALLAASLLLVALAPTASAKSETANFDFLVASGPLCGLDPLACPAIAAASNGETIEVTGSGAISVHPMSASGGGSFVHRDALGVMIAEGNWTVDGLISFHSYGSGAAQGLPEDFWGGQATLAVTFTVGTVNIPGVLVVDCELGKVPGGAAEGVTVLVTRSPSVPHAVNFNESVSGLTVFINTTP